MKILVTVIAVTCVLTLFKLVVIDNDYKQQNLTEVQITEALFAGDTIAFVNMPLHLKHGFVDEATAVRIAKATGRSPDEIFKLYRELGFVHNVQPTTAPATMPAH